MAGGLCFIPYQNRWCVYELTRTRMGGAIVREFGMSMCTHCYIYAINSIYTVGPYCLYKMDKQQAPTVYHMELCSMLCGSLDGRGV